MSAAPRVLLFTYREGLLSRFGHDLRLSARQFDIQLRKAAITARVWPRALRVDGAMQAGALDPSAPSVRDRATIEHTLRTELLQADHYPEITFEGAAEPLSGGRFAIEGQLRLLGSQVSITATAFRTDEQIVVRGELRPSRWGIRPYRAMGGALRVQDRVTLEVGVPIEVAGLDLETIEHAEARWSSGHPDAENAQTPSEGRGWPGIR